MRPEVQREYAKRYADAGCGVRYAVMEAAGDHLLSASPFTDFARNVYFVPIVPWKVAARPRTLAFHRLHEPAPNRY